MNFKKNLEAREEAFFLFQLISLKCGTNFEKTNKKKKKQERRQTSECLKGSHLPYQIYTCVWIEFCNI